MIREVGRVPTEGCVGKKSTEERDENSDVATLPKAARSKEDGARGKQGRIGGHAHGAWLSMCVKVTSLAYCAPGCWHRQKNGTAKGVPTPAKPACGVCNMTLLLPPFSDAVKIRIHTQFLALHLIQHLNQIGLLSDI